jgi:multicomponent Na+:H+ antiporter subunit C
MNNQLILQIAFYGAAIALITIGLYAVVTKRNLIKIVFGLSILDSGVNLLFITMGYVSNGTAPIFSPSVMEKYGTVKEAAQVMVDPVPQALVLTAIVIGFGVTAVALALVIRLYRHHNTTNIDEIRNLKW